MSALVLAIGLAVGACGGVRTTADQEIRSAVRELQRAFAAADSDRVCRLLSRDARKHIRGMGHDLNPQASPPCYLDLFMFIEGVQQARDWRERIDREVRDIEIDGDRATATILFGDGQSANLPLVHEDGRWRIDALYGGIPAGRQRDHY